VVQGKGTAVVRWGGQEVGGGVGMRVEGSGRGGEAIVVMEGRGEREGGRERGGEGEIL